MHSYQLFHQHQQHEREIESSLLLKNYSHLCEKWALTKAESYRLLSLNTLHQLAHWEQNVVDIALTDEQIERLSYLLAIYQILEKQLPKSKASKHWIREQQAHLTSFVEQTPLDIFMKADKKALNKLLLQLQSFFAD